MGEDKKEILAHWMIRHDFATGHGDTIEDLLDELKWQIAERFERAVASEREACAKVCEEQANELWLKNCDSEGYGAEQCSVAIRSRGLK